MHHPINKHISYKRSSVNIHIHSTTVSTIEVLNVTVNEAERGKILKMDNEREVINEPVSDTVVNAGARPVKHPSVVVLALL